jgi:hypothetical protein
MTMTTQRVRVAGAGIERYSHVCALFSSREQEYAVLAPFVRDGISNGDKNIHIVDPQRREDHRARLRRSGIDIDGAERERTLELVEWMDAYLKGGRFDVESMLGIVRQTLDRSAAEGRPFSRILGQMAWALEDRPGVGGLLEYEARVNTVLEDYRQVAVCAYEVERYSGDTVVGVLRTHPAVIIGGRLHENPFFVPPDEFLKELEERPS